MEELSIKETRCEICGYFIDLEDLQEPFPTICEDCQTDQDKFNNYEGKGY